MKRMHSMPGIAAAVALACAAPFALAQTTPAQQPPEHPQSGAMTHTPPYQTSPARTQQEMPPSMPQAAHTDSGMAMGQHDMTGTVRTIGANGIVDVRTAVGTLRVHFPDASQHLKKGEKITLHLSYTVASSTPSSM
ncbi:MAG: hypothetical protein OJF55_001834 [Rhodanobacteraceae bacterium]|jgi:hypothetical protein|nr:MAG: hypothetical protein OJF55_001834 [Rhodanobacteraceae bacterium]